jgi:two-component system, sensor histidine kinase and response regulator
VETLKVLAVDDELGMRMAIARALAHFTVTLPDIEGEFGYDVEQSGTGEEALELIAQKTPDILLLDHNLPGISGLDVLNELLQRNQPVLTVMVTAYASLDTAITATKRGAYDFLAKPFTPEELRAVIRKTTKHFVLERQAQRMAVEKRQVRFQFISVLAHELKSPLAAVESFLSLLKDPTMLQDPETHAHVVNRALIRLNGMSKLITDILDLTRLESGQKKRELGPVDLIDVARSSIESAEPEANRRGIRLTLNAPPPVGINADRGEMEIIFNNLVSNAVKYNRDNGSVTVSVQKSNDAVTITVADTGIGMKPEEVAKLFQEFVRIKNEKTRNILGSGLGLSILKKLAVLYGGDTSVESTPDVGSTFTVTLLDAPTSPPEPPEPATA